jgi:hypothetical protein
MINSPRSLKACQELGILPIELYQISIEEYKNRNKDSFTMDQKVLKYRYDGFEKFRNESINLARKRREIIIYKENANTQKSRKSKSENSFIMRSLEKMKEGEKKAMENLKNQQRKNIKSIIEDQINHEILKKVEKKNEWKQQKREEQIMKEKKENEMNKKKAEEANMNERRKKMEEENQQKKIFREKIREQYMLEEETKKKETIRI